MRLFKLVITSLIILFAIITAIGLFFPSTVRVSRAVNIAASYDTVYKYLEDVKYWKLWMDGADTATIAFLSTRTAGEGTVATIGTGQVTITRCTKDSIYSIWKSAKGNIQNSAFTFLNNTAQQNTTVQWYFDQKLNWYPWERFGSMANDKILGPIMEESFNKLKQVLEKK